MAAPIQIESYNGDGRQYVIDDAAEISWSSHYGETGGGFGYLRFSLARDVGTDHKDIGFGYRIIVRKYLNTILFDGQIRQIEESSSGQDETINITALGWVIVAQDDEIYRRFCDTRKNQWTTPGEQPKDSYRPDNFTHGANAAAGYIHCNDNSLLSTDDYIDYVYVLTESEIVEQVKCEVSLMLGFGTGGPDFTADIASISGAVITYDNEVNEGNLPGNTFLINFSKRSIATIESSDSGTNTITVTDEDHIVGWEEDDVIYLALPLFSATISSIASDVITYSGAVGESVVDATTGWVLYNATRSDYATVSAWGTGTVTVTNSADISTWSGTDIIQIFTPFAASLHNDVGTQLWPVSDWRQGAVIQSHTAIDIDTTASPTWVYWRFKCYLEGTGAATSFVSFYNLRTFSIDNDSNATTLAEYIVSLLTDHGISASTDDVESITKTLEPMIFEFSSPAEAMEWACAAGDGSGNLLAWGIRPDSGKVFYLEAQDRTTIDYIVRRDMPTSASAGGDVQESVQVTRGVYQDSAGIQKTTAWISDTDYYFVDGYKRKSIKLDNVTDPTEALALAQLYLDENKVPKASAQYSVNDGAVFTRGGVKIPVDELKATGHLIAIEDWRAAEISSESDLRNTWTHEQIVGVEVDYNAGTAKLIPASAKSTFDQYMAELSRIKER